MGKRAAADACVLHPVAHLAKPIVCGKRAILHPQQDACAVAVDARGCNIAQRCCVLDVDLDTPQVALHPKVATAGEQSLLGDMQRVEVQKVA